MADRHGVASWPGALAVESCSYTCSHGTQPGVAVLRVQPQSGGFAPFGTLVISDGVGTVALPGCRLLSVHQIADESGRVLQLTIQDRRWRWSEFGILRGSYNQRDPHGRVLAWSARTVPQLIALCFAAMGEEAYTLNLPTVATSTEEIYPATEWDGTNPAFALTQLCERIGCRVIYQPLTNTVLVAPVGSGGPLPDGSIAHDGPSITSPPAPDRILLQGAPVRYQMRLALEAVGKEWDGSYRPLRYLSYAPVVGTFGALEGYPFAECYPPNFKNIQGTDRLSQRQAQALAAESVYRCYQIVNLDPAARLLGQARPLTVPGYGPIQRVQQIVPQDTQVEQLVPQANDPNLIGPDGRPLDQPFYDGYSRDRPAQVFGAHYRPATGVRHNKDAPSGNTGTDDEVRVAFSIDPIWMVVTFSQYVFLRKTVKINGVDRLISAPAQLVLQTGCQVRDAVTNQIVRFEAASGPAAVQTGAPAAVIRHEDVQLNVIGLYNAVTHGLTGIVSDAQRAAVMANYYLAAAAARYAPQLGQERVYNGIVPIALSGAVQQVTWSVGPGGAETHASLNFEHNLYVPTFPERLRLQYLAPPQRALANGAGGRPGGLGERDPSLWKGKPL
jgi:hypothetical protein